MSDIRFIVNKEKGVVICQLLHCHNIPMSRVAKYTHGYTFYDGNLEINNTFTGVAKCSKEDEWDEEYGKQLALTRAKRRRGIAINRALKSYIENRRNDLDNLEKYGIHRLPELEE